MGTNGHAVPFSTRKEGVGFFNAEKKKTFLAIISHIGLEKQEESSYTVI